MTKWQLQEAKTQLSALIELAQSKGPQVITRHGADRAVVLSMKDYKDLTTHKLDFKQHLLGGPKVDSFPLKRNRDLGRLVEL